MSNRIVIESKDNSKVKLINSLKAKKYRDKHKLMIIEGLRAVKQLIESKISLEMIVFSESMYLESEDCKKIHMEHDDISIIIKDNIFSQLSDTVNTQGVIAISKIPKYEIDEFYKAEKSRILLFDRIQDPGNAGTLIRTADAAGFDAIFVIKGTADLFSPKVNRSAMGSNLYVPIIEVSEEELHNFQKYGFEILATALDRNSFEYDDVNYSKKCIIVLGNEANGVSESILAFADKKIYIPIYGKAESLNVAIAGAVVMYKSLEYK